MGWLDCRNRDEGAAAPPPEDTSEMETPDQKRRRWRSIYVIYFTMFLMSLGFTIILPGVWPYLNKLDPSASKGFMGLIVGANPLAQMCFSPLIGWWGNKLGSIRLPLLASLLTFTLASSIYSVLEVFEDEHRKYWMLLSRFLVGLSSANIAVCRSYLSAATTLRERTGAVSMVSLAQTLGFVAGPALQAAVTPLGNTGVSLIPGRLTLNMFTATGWINVVMGLCNFAMFLPFCFREHKIAAKEAMLNLGAESEKETWRLTKPDLVTSWTLITAFFVLLFNFVLLETLGTVLTMEQFAWTNKQALNYMGIIMTVGGVVATITFAGIGPLCKRFAERRVLLWGGFFLMVLAQGLLIPWGPDPPRLAVHNATAGDNVTEIVGCPVTQAWCSDTRAMTLTQFLLGYALTSVGYPVGVTLITTIFSKVLGSRPQGVWMGLLTGSGCCSRVLGPVFVTYVYTTLGTVWTFSMTTATMAVASVWLFLMDGRLARVDALAGRGAGAKAGEAREMGARGAGDEQPLHTANKVQIQMQEPG